jgi:hypothetical protein
LYHLVVMNVASNASSNYSALNHLYTWDTLQPKQPLLSDLDLAILKSKDASGSSWSVDMRHTPVIDLEYSNGVHDGQSYLGSRQPYYALVGGQNTVRERFTVSGGDRVVTSMWVRLNRQSGSGLLTLRLEAGDGSVIEQHQVPGSNSIKSWALGSDSDLGDWVGVNLDAPRTLRNGQTYNLRLTAPSGTTYAIVNLLNRDSSDINGEYLKSHRFSDGRTQKSTDGGASWSLVDPNWAAYSNMQFYFTVDR